MLISVYSNEVKIGDLIEVLFYSNPLLRTGHVQSSHIKLSIVTAIDISGPDIVITTLISKRNYYFSEKVTKCINL